MYAEPQDIATGGLIDTARLRPTWAERAAPIAGFGPQALPRILRSLRALAVGLFFPAALLLLWDLSARYGWLPRQILPDPRLVLLTFQDFIVSGDLLFHTEISLRRLLLGFAVGASTGLLFGVAMGLSRKFEDYFDPLFLALAQIPSLGWIPFVMILVGIDEGLKIIIIAKATFVPVALNSYKGIRNVPASYLEVGRVLTFGPRLTLRKIVLPAAVPPIFTGIRYGLTHAWMALVAVELVVSSEGIGYLTVWGRQLFQLDILLMALVVIGVIGFALDRSLALIERRLDRWRLVAA
jgi:sulfonate transport system permease protein